MTKIAQVGDLALNTESAHERIIRNAFRAATTHGASFGPGGKAMADIYKNEPIDPETMLGMIAIMANGLADLEPR